MFWAKYSQGFLNNFVFHDIKSKVVIVCLQNKRAVVVDEVPVKLIKHCKHGLSKYIISLINLSIGKFLDAIQIELRDPILTKRDGTFMENFVSEALFKKN